MYAISNMVDIWGAKVHKRSTYYGWSDMSGGKPKLKSINGVSAQGLKVSTSKMYFWWKFAPS